MSYHVPIESNGIKATAADFFGGPVDIGFSVNDLDKLANLDIKMIKTVILELKIMAQIQDYIIMSEFHFTQINPTSKMEQLPHIVDLLRDHVHGGNELFSKASVVSVEIRDKLSGVISKYNELLDQALSRLTLLTKAKGWEEERLRRRRNQIGYIYILKSGHGYKIGKSANYKKRTADIIGSMPFKCDVFLVIKMKGYHYAEPEIHALVSGVKINGEWFDLSSNDICEVVYYLGERFDGEMILDRRKVEIGTKV